MKSLKDRGSRLEEEIISQIEEETDRLVYRVPAEYEAEVLALWFDRDPSLEALVAKLNAVAYIDYNYWKPVMIEGVTKAYEVLVYHPLSRAVMSVVSGKVEGRIDFCFFETNLVDPYNPKIESGENLSYYQEIYISREEYRRRMKESKEVVEKDVEVLKMRGELSGTFDLNDEYVEG